MKRKLKHILEMVVVMAMVMSLLVGCGSGGSASPAASEQAGKSDMTIIYTSECNSVLPGNDSVSNGLMIQANLFDSLILESNGDRTNFQPGLATAWEYSEDGATITFELRQGVKFHDGTEMTAEDVAFSLNIDKDAPYNSTAKQLIESIDVIDDTHISITTKYAYKPILSIIAMPSFGIFSKAWYEQCEKDGTNMARNENGTGPYKLTEWVSGEKLVMVANEDWWGGAPEIKTITVKVYTDATTAALAMEQGQADVFFGLNSADREHVAAAKGITIVDVPSNGTHFVAYNENPAYGSVFQEKAVRKAAQYAYNREEILIGGLNSVGTVTPYCVNPGHFGYIEGYEATPYDPEQGAKLLAESGYDGSKIIFKSANDSWFQNPAQVINEELRVVGFNVDLQIEERATWNNDALADFSCDMFNYMTWASIPDADSDLWGYLHTSGQGVEYANVAYAGNAECDALLEAARFSLDDEERIDLYKQIADINEEEAWYSFLMTGSNAVVISDAIKGFEPHPAQFYRFNFWSF